MYDYLVGMSFEEVVESLSAQGVSFDFGEQSFDECVRDESWELYIGGLYSDSHYDVEFDEQGFVESVELWDEGWD